MSRRYDDDYEGSSFEKFTNRKGKKHKKGHQSRSSNSERYQWEQLMEVEVESYSGSRSKITNTNVIDIPTKVNITTVGVPAPVKTEHQFSVNTHEIKGVKIDFDGVADMQKIENIKNGITTYGIKFLFKGKKGLYRIVWYNTNVKGRDIAYDNEYEFWITIQQKNRG